MPYKKYSKRLITKEIIREINVYVGDMTKTDQHYDLVLCSSLKNTYVPMNHSFIESLYYAGIDVNQLSENPDKNGKDFGFWVSKRIESSFFDRLCCFEFMPARIYGSNVNFRGVFDFFLTMLTYDNKYNFKTIATPLLGTNNVGLTHKQVIPVMLQTALQSFINSSSLIEFSIYCMRDETADEVNNALLTLLDKPYDVFISYPHEREDEMIEITTILEQKNIKVWTDKKKLKGGDEFDDVIANAIDKSKTFLFLWFLETEESTYCAKELEYALDLNKCIIPYRCSNELDGNTEMGKKIARRNWLNMDKCNYKQLADNIELILRDIETLDIKIITEE